MLSDVLKRDVIAVFDKGCQGKEMLGKEYRGHKQVLFSILPAHDNFLLIPELSELSPASAMVCTHLALLHLLTFSSWAMMFRFNSYTKRKAVISPADTIRYTYSQF